MFVVYMSAFIYIEVSQQSATSPRQLLVDVTHSLGGWVGGWGGVGWVEWDGWSGIKIKKKKKKKKKKTKKKKYKNKKKKNILFLSSARRLVSIGNTQKEYFHPVKGLMGLEHRSFGFFVPQTVLALRGSHAFNLVPRISKSWLREPLRSHGEEFPSLVLLTV